MSSDPERPVHQPVADAGHGPSGRSGEYPQVVRYVGIVVALALAATIAGALTPGWTSTVLLILGPTVVFVGGLGAVGRTYATWKRHGKWQTWQGAMWFLFVMFVAWVFTTLPIVT